MTIKVSDFDYSFFIKQQFILNIAMGVVGYFFLLTISDGLEKKILNISYIVYFFGVIFLYVFCKRDRDIFKYSLHRIVGHYFVSFVFFTIGAMLILEASNELFYLTVLIYIFSFLYFFFKKNKEKKYYDVLERKYYESGEIQLYDFYEHLDIVKNKKNNFTPVLVIVGMQVGLILVLNGFMKVPDVYGAVGIISIFFLIALFILNKVSFYLMVPYNFLKNVEI